MGKLRLTGLANALLLSACAHSGAGPALPAGTYDLASLRSHLSGREVELTPAGSAVEGAGGASHIWSAQGSLALGRDGSCLLVIDVRVDDAAPGHSERPCTWHTAGDLVSLVDTGGVATIYRVRHQGDRVLLLEVLAGPGGAQDKAGGERLVLEPQLVSAPLARQEAGPEAEGAAAGERGDRRP